MDSLLDCFREEWYCAINQTQIQDPVLTIDGHTYERTAIQQWFKSSFKSPKTGLMLSDKTLISNLALKSLKDKILHHVPQLIDKMNNLQSQNKILKHQVKQLREQINEIRQKKTQQEQISKKERKLKKIEQKRSEDRKNYINQLKQQINKLQQELIEYKKKQITWKANLQKVVDQHQLRQEIKNKQIKKLENEVIQVEQSFKCMIRQVNSQIHNLVMVICIMIKEIQIYEKLKHTKFYNNPKQLYQYKISSSIRMKIHHLFKLSSFYTEFVPSQILQFYQIYKYLIQDVVGQGKIQELNFRSGIYLDKNKKADLYTIVDIDILDRLRQQMRKKSKLTVIDKAIRDKIYYINDSILLQQDWNKITQCIKYYKGISVLDIQFDEQISIKRQQLQIMKRIEEINLNGTQLSQQSQRILHEFSRQYPRISIVYNYKYNNPTNNDIILQNN